MEPLRTLSVIYAQSSTALRWQLGQQDAAFIEPTPFHRSAREPTQHRGRRRCRIPQVSRLCGLGVHQTGASSCATSVTSVTSVTCGLTAQCGRPRATRTPHKTSSSRSCATRDNCRPYRWAMRWSRQYWVRRMQRRGQPAIAHRFLSSFRSPRCSSILETR